MRFLVTGVAGFIGSHLADRLVADGHEVWGVDNYETGRRENVNSNVAFFLCNIVHREHFYAVANDCKPDVVIHCAASYSDPNLWHRDTDTNVTGTINATLVAKHHGSKLVYFQTALPPISSYAISKIAGEQYINLAGVPALIFRLANIYGPRNLSGPIPSFYKLLAAGEACTVVDTARDMVYIADLVDAVVGALEPGLNEPGRRGVYDMCSGQDYRIIELYRQVAQALGDQPEFADPVVRPRPDDDVPNMQLDPTRALTHLSWLATTPLSLGVAAAVDWYHEHGVEQTFTHLKLAS